MLRIIVFLCMVFTLPVFAQHTSDSLNKFDIIYDFSLGLKTLTVNDFNKTSSVKIPSAIAYVGQNFAFGQPFKYFLSADIGLGMSVGYFFDSKKTFISVINYGLSVHRSFTIRRNFFISPFAGWQNQASYCSFSKFVYNNQSHARINQNNFLFIGCDFSVFMRMLGKNKSGDNLNRIGVKVFYQLPLASAHFKEGAELFPSGIHPFGLGGWALSLFGRF